MIVELFGLSKLHLTVIFQVCRLCVSLPVEEELKYVTATFFQRMALVRLQLYTDETYIYTMQSGKFFF